MQAELKIIEKNKQRVLTTKQLAEVYNASEQQIQQNFNNNEHRFIENKHYYFLQGKVLRDFKSQFDNIEEALGISKYSSQLYLWTERGASRHCKILDTDKAWEQFDYLENTYFNVKEKTYQSNFLKIPFKEQVECIDIIASSLKVNDASKILMYSTLYKDYNLPTNFLPQYELNGNKELKSATELLKRFDLKINVLAFNKLLKENSYLEEKTRISGKYKNRTKKYNALTEKGLEYGENAISSQNQREVQPLYYVDSFKKLFEIVTQKVGVAL